MHAHVVKGSLMCVCVHAYVHVHMHAGVYFFVFHFREIVGHSWLLCGFICKEPCTSRYYKGYLLYTMFNVS